jgi:hypothetical protein
VKRAIAQLAAAEGRLLSIRDELFGRAWQLGKLLPAIKERVRHGKWMIWLPDGTLEDAPDLGFRNRQFQSVPFRFQIWSIYDGKTPFWAMGLDLTSGE